MGMSKAELQYHRDSYHELLSKSRNALNSGSPLVALSIAIESWAHIEGMIRFERKAGTDTLDSIEGIDVVLDLCPLFFNTAVIDQAAAFVRDVRRMQKHVSVNYQERIAFARDLTREALRLCDILEKSEGASGHDLLGSSTVARESGEQLLDDWCRIGFLSRHQDGSQVRYHLTTDLRHRTRAKCPSCGAVVRGMKNAMLAAKNCPKCATAVHFVWQE